jgi:dinuclear metal center YbgI/SA1388 family protein
MSYTLATVRGVVERIWPVEGAEAWDAPGLLSGDPESEISRVLLAIDAVRDTVDEAIELSADLLLVHHPLLLRGVTSISEDRYKGSLLARLIRARCALLAAHTNADVVADGVSAVLADALGILDARPIVSGEDPTTGIGRVGALPAPTSLGNLARQVANLLPPTASGVRVAGEYTQQVSTVAVCGGAGDSLLNESAVVAADVYITADLRHHPASEAREQTRVNGGPALIDVSHWASEWLWLDTAAAQLAHELPELELVVSETRTDPWDFVVVQ